MLPSKLGATKSTGVASRQLNAGPRFQMAYNFMGSSAAIQIPNNGSRAPKQPAKDKSNSSPFLKDVLLAGPDENMVPCQSCQKMYASVHHGNNPVSFSNYLLKGRSRPFRAPGRFVRGRGF